MRPKEINAIIQAQTEDFFKQEGLKYVKKDMGYVQKTDKYRAEYGFVYYEYHPEYSYAITLFIQLTDVEKIYNKIDGSNILGPTYVFKLSYFLDKNNYINNNNPEWTIKHQEDIAPFSQALMDNYTKYVKDFIPFITQPKNMLNFLLAEIETGKRYAIRQDNFARALILMKLLNYPMEEIQTKLADFKAKLANVDVHIKQKYYKELDDIVTGNWEQIVNNMDCIKEIVIKNSPEDNTPIINVLDNGTSYLLFNEWPMDDDYFSDDEIDNFEQILSSIVEAKAIQEDRERFVIMTNNLQKIQNLQIYLEEKIGNTSKYNDSL
ncbi:hypothetical protein [Streptococcus plurextorum]|uniref:hypothetical protein n=1 Tax=Streptococcus plurextorum TaxID=456876 RepID=UPI00040D4C96|nr:hypothetical protein [Streptococcus plurextorum]